MFALEANSSQGFDSTPAIIMNIIRAYWDNLGTWWDIQELAVKIFKEANLLPATIIKGENLNLGDWKPGPYILSIEKDFFSFLHSPFTFSAKMVIHKLWMLFFKLH